LGAGDQVGDTGELRRREVEARRLIAEIHETLLLNQDKLAASLNYGKIVYRRTSSKQLDIQLSIKLDSADS
jgi:hypothetical protein